MLHPQMSVSWVSSPVEGVRAEQPASGLVVYIASRAAEFVEVIDAVIEALLLCSSIRMDGAAGVLRRPHRVAVIPISPQWRMGTVLGVGCRARRRRFGRMRRRRFGWVRRATMRRAVARRTIVRRLVVRRSVMRGLAMRGLAIRLAMWGLAMRGLAMWGLAMRGLAMWGLALRGLALGWFTQVFLFLKRRNPTLFVGNYFHRAERL